MDLPMSLHLHQEHMKDLEKKCSMDVILKQEYQKIADEPDFMLAVLLRQSLSRKVDKESKNYFIERTILYNFQLLGRITDNTLKEELRKLTKELPKLEEEVNILDAIFPRFRYNYHFVTPRLSEYR